MKKWVGLVLALAVLFAVSLALADVNIAEAFPDEAFRQYALNRDWNGDGFLSEQEVQYVDYISCGYEQIGDLTGIEYFTNLEVLDCCGNSLKSLDLSRNTELLSLNCSGNKLKSLDVSGSSKLEYLACDNNSLTSLNISGCAELKKLYCNRNSLKTLDVSGCPELEELYCAENRMGTLKLGSHPMLKTLSIEYNSVSSLNTGALPSLDMLDCDENSLTALDVSGCAQMRTLSCRKNKLKTLKLGSLPELTDLECSENRLSSLDVSGCPALDELECGDNGLKTLDVSRNTALESLGCSRNKMKELKIGGAAALRWIRCSGNSLGKLDVSKCPALQSIDCSSNSLTKLDLSHCPAIGSIECNGNKLKELKIGSAPGLSSLYCGSNNLSKLDLSKCPALEYISCSGNKLTKLDVSKSASLYRCVAKEKRYMGDGYPCVDSIGGGMTIDYNVTVKAGKKTSKPQKIYQKVKEVVTSVTNSGMSEKDKARKMHDWLVRNAHYDYTFTNYHPSGVLLQGAGVCQSYAEAYALLLDEVGIKNIIVIGTAHGEGHAWNYANIDGIWRHIDVTWDDGSGYQYFMVTSAQIGRDHYWEMELPGDSGGTNAYRVAQNGIIYSVDAAYMTTVVIGVENKDVTKLTIPSSITARNKTYNVTAIGDGALKGLKNLKELTIGENVLKIGASALSGCKKLKKITVKTQQLYGDNIGKDAFKNINKSVVFKCPKGRKEDYENMFRKKGAPKKAKFK